MLQSPVVHRASIAMSLFHINLGHSGIVPDHIQRAMPQQGLHREDIPTRPEISDRKGMPEAVGVALLHLCPFSQGDHQLAQTIGGQIAAMHTHEEWCILFIAIVPGCQITPEGLLSALPKVDDPSLAALCSTVLPVPDEELVAPYTP